MIAFQPDLWDTGEAEQQIRDARPHTCPHCGQTAPSRYDLLNLHGCEPDGTFSPTDQHVYRGRCRMQYIAADFIRLTVLGYTEPESAARTWERARQLGLDPDAIAKEATA